MLFVVNIMLDFIEVYDGAASADDCDFVIDWFEKSKPLQIPGYCGNRTIKKEIKDSTDITTSLIEDVPPSPIVFKAIETSMNQYKETYPFVDKISPYASDLWYNIQRYEPNQGYFGEHCEHESAASQRVLGWTLYLNTVTDGGETYYTFYDRKVEAVQGRMCIFPAYWTHAHKGIVSRSQSKYIATGWISFR